MTEPLRPDDSPNDFAFLNTEPVVSANDFGNAAETEFVGLPVSDGHDFANLNFEQLKFDSTRISDSELIGSAVPEFDGRQMDFSAIGGLLPDLSCEPNDHQASEDLDISSGSNIVEIQVEPPAEQVGAEVSAEEQTEPEISQGVSSAADTVMNDADSGLSDVFQDVKSSNLSAPVELVAAVALSAVNVKQDLVKPAAVSPSSPSKRPSSNVSPGPTSSLHPTQVSRSGEGTLPSAKGSPAVLGYAIAVTLLLLTLVVTGRVSLFGHHALESLPDLRPLAPNEFRRVPDGTPVPEGHVLKLGESRRFGDVLVTPVRVTRESLRFQGFLTGEPEETLTTSPVLKLWLKFENQSGVYGFPPYDAGLMSNRTPPISSGEKTLANSFLMVAGKSDAAPVRVLNYLQTMDSNFVLTGQESSKVIMPEESVETFIACSEDIESVGANAESEYTWRVQFRKGVNESSGNGVTTLVDVRFTGTDIH